MLEIIALLHPIHFFLVWNIAKADKIISKLKRNYAIMYLDWFFVLMNLSLVWNQSFDLKWFLIFIALCAIPTAYLKYGWRKSITHKKRKETTLFFNADGNLNGVGLVHGAFMILQGSLCLMFFFSPANSNSYFLGLLALMGYLITYCLVIKFVRKLRLNQKIEMPFILLGILAVIIRSLIAMYELQLF